MSTEGRMGLTSLRDERMKVVASFCSGRVLDIGCGPGNLFINRHIGTQQGVGVDIFNYEGVDTIVDPTKLPFEDGSFDTVTLIAVGGHIPKDLRVKEFQEFARVLRPGGRLIMTEGEPVTQLLTHKWEEVLAKFTGVKGMDEERGMEHEEEYCMPYQEIMQYLNSYGLKFELRKKFMWGLNNVYIAKKTSPTFC